MELLIKTKEVKIDLIMDVIVVTALDIIGETGFLLYMHKLIGMVGGV